MSNVGDIIEVDGDNGIELRRIVSIDEHVMEGGETVTSTVTEPVSD